MKKSNMALVIAAIAGGALSFFAMRAFSPGEVAPTPMPADHAGPAAAPLPSNEGALEEAIRFYRARVTRDPEDTRSQNALAEHYLQRVRETGNEDDLPLALVAARASLAAVPAEQNFGGLTALAHAEFANHDFAAARAHALQLVALRPDQSDSYAALGDACLELGDYERAADAFAQMAGRGAKDVGTETRLARWAMLRGQTQQARQHFLTALALLRDLPQPPRDPVAWCHWQLGEIAFAIGEYATAERHYQDALTVAPDSFRALGSLGRLRAAHGDLPAAIQLYEQAARLAPSVDFMGALGDLYRLSGREKEAAARYELAEQLGEHSRKVHGTPHDRALANFYANHDLKPEEAYTLARGEYEAGRRDIYGADALAWTALKSGRIAEAQTAIAEALRLGTQDARLFYHAGMIARAAGDAPAARAFMQRALDLNPGFDPLQSAIARKAVVAGGVDPGRSGAQPHPNPPGSAPPATTLPK
ncbi:hypothetical protein BH20VER3_BH20VER3_18300 [soil metagenome]